MHTQVVLVQRIYGLLLNTINIRLDSLMRLCVYVVLLFVNMHTIFKQAVCSGWDLACMSYEVKNNLFLL